MDGPSDDRPVSPPSTDDGDDSASIIQTRASVPSSATSVSSDYSPFPLAPPRPKIDVLDKDKNTPDSHVPRDSRLIRLTGVHPYNVEAPLSELFNEGFLTSPELFYVRNHGAVPEVHDDEVLGWECEVEG